MLWKPVLVGALLWFGMAGTAAAGEVALTSSSCGDALSDLICKTGTLLFGPNGVVRFTTHQVEWARGVVFDVVFIAFPLGGAL